MLLTVKQVASMLNTSGSMVYKLAGNLELQSVKVGDCVRFTLESVEDYIRTNIRKSKNTQEQINDLNFQSPFMEM